MARPKKSIPSLRNHTYYYAVSDPDHIDSGNEIYPQETEEKAVSELREDEGEVEEIWMYEIKLVGRYKVNFSLEKID